MKVYIVHEDDYDTGYGPPKKAFDTEEKAKAYCQKEPLYDYTELELE